MHRRVSWLLIFSALCHLHTFLIKYKNEKQGYKDEHCRIVLFKDSKVTIDDVEKCLKLGEEAKESDKKWEFK